MAELKRSIGYIPIIAIAVTTLMGTGFFFGPMLAAQYSGNASLLAWIMLSLITIYIGVGFGELVSMFPSAGGVYEFAKKSYSRFTSFIVGWITWLVATITPALLIIASLKYVLPSNFHIIYIILIAIMLTILLNYVAFRGIDISTMLVVVFSIITLAVLFSLIIPGMFEVNISNFSPFFSAPVWFIFLSLFFIMESYFGWESTTFLAEETKNPEKVIPRSLLISGIIVSVLGICFAFVMLGNIVWTELINMPVGVGALSSILYGATGAKIIKIGVFITLLGSAAGGIISAPRLLLALSRDKLFINSFAEIHEKRQTPYKAIMFQAAVSVLIILIASGTYKTILSILVPLALIMYISVLLCIPILRRKYPDAKRFYKLPLGTVGPILISLLYVAIIVAWLFLEHGAIYLFGIIVSIILFGAPIYLLLMNYYDPFIIVNMNDFFAYLSLWLEKILVPKHLKQEIFDELGDIKGKKIFEYGCSVGSMTLDIAEKVGPTGKVYGTDIAHRAVKIAIKRTKKKGYKHVTLIHDIHQINNVHSSIPQVDIAVSIGFFGYIQDLKKVLKGLNQILSEGGKIFFVDYAELFKIIPNAGWIAEEKKLRRVFRECGFSVTVRRKKDKFWNYLLVHGIKTKYKVPYV